MVEQPNGRAKLELKWKVKEVEQIAEVFTTLSNGEYSGTLTMSSPDGISFTLGIDKGDVVAIGNFKGTTKVQEWREAFETVDLEKVTLALFFEQFVSSVVVKGLHLNVQFVGGRFDAMEDGISGDSVSLMNLSLSVAKLCDESAWLTSDVKDFKLGIKVGKLSGDLELQVTPFVFKLIGTLYETKNVLDTAFSIPDYELALSVLKRLKDAGWIEFTKGSIEVSELVSVVIPKDLEDKIVEVLNEGLGFIGEMAYEDAKKELNIKRLTIKSLYLLIDKMSDVLADCNYKGRSCREVILSLVKEFESNLA